MWYTVYECMLEGQRVTGLFVGTRNHSGTWFPRVMRAVTNRQPAYLRDTLPITGLAMTPGLVPVGLTVGVLDSPAAVAAKMFSDQGLSHELLEWLPLPARIAAVRWDARFKEGPLRVHCADVSFESPVVGWAVCHEGRVRATIETDERPFFEKPTHVYVPGGTRGDASYLVLVSGRRLEIDPVFPHHWANEPA